MRVEVEVPVYVLEILAKHRLELTGVELPPALLRKAPGLARVVPHDGDPGSLRIAIQEVPGHLELTLSLRGTLASRFLIDLGPDLVRDLFRKVDGHHTFRR